MPARMRPLLGSAASECIEALFGFVDSVRIERCKGCALGRRARNAGVHLRELGFILLEAGGEVSVIGMSA